MHSVHSAAACGLGARPPAAGNPGCPASCSLPPPLPPCVPMNEQPCPQNELLQLHPPRLAPLHIIPPPSHLIKPPANSKQPLICRFHSCHQQCHFVRLPAACCRHPHPTALPAGGADACSLPQPRLLYHSQHPMCAAAQWERRRALPPAAAMQRVFPPPLPSSVRYVSALLPFVSPFQSTDPLILIQAAILTI